MDANLSIPLERPAGISLSEQIRRWISAAIHDGRLQAGARLPSWRDLAAQLGVARGTVRVAYERLGDEQLIVACGPAGTFVAAHVPVVAPVAGIDAMNVPSHAVLSELVPRLGAAPMPFQMGVPAHDAFPTAAWSRLAARSDLDDGRSRVSRRPRGRRCRLNVGAAPADRLHDEPIQCNPLQGSSRTYGGSHRIADQNPQTRTPFADRPCDVHYQNAP
jgi:DNA-binding transcriptional MocR family regulator